MLNATYWSSAGTFGDLDAEDNYNKATGAWWAYKWYGEMTGRTVTVTPPNANAEGLQGVASIDEAKNQVRILFGGSAEANAIVSGLEAQPLGGDAVHATVWQVDSTGKNPSSGAKFKQEDDYTVTNGSITIPVGNMTPTSAYFLILSPGNASSPNHSNERYEAEYAEIGGTAETNYGKGTGYSGTSFVGGYESSNNAATTFVVNAENNAYYTVRLRYAAGVTE